MVLQADPATPIHHGDWEAHPEHNSPSDHAIHQLQQITLMSHRVESLQERGTAGMSVLEVVYDGMATSPGELEVDRVINPIFPDMPYFQLGQMSRI